VELTSERGEQRCSVPVKKDVERGRSSSEGWRRCGMFHVWRCPFFVERQRAQVAGKGGGMVGVTAMAVNGV
jgi:hypothetical protein